MQEPEDPIIRAAIKLATLRAADLIDAITSDDVTEMKRQLLQSGMSPQMAATLDRGHVASERLRFSGKHYPINKRGMVRNATT